MKSITQSSSHMFRDSHGRISLPKLVKVRLDCQSCLIFPVLFSVLEKLASACVAFSTCGITDVILVSSIFLFGYSQITASRRNVFVGNDQGTSAQKKTL